MYIQEKINQAFKIFRQDPSLENRDALMAECEDLIDVVLSTTAGTSEDKDIRNEVEQDVNVKLLEFLSNPLLRDRAWNPSTFLFGFVKRSVLNCLSKIYPSKLCPECKGTRFVEGATCQVCLGKGRVPIQQPKPLPTVEKLSWTRPEPKATKPKAMKLKRKKSKYYREQGGHFGPTPDKRTKEFQFFQKLFRENRREFQESTRTEQGKMDWAHDMKKVLEGIARNPRISSLTRVKPYLRKARFSKKTR